MSRKPKRKIIDMNEQNVKNKRKRPLLILENAPPANSIKDLIEIGNSIKFYKNLDTIMLWRITPYLEMLDKMIGMNTLKDSIFYQIIYYLKGMHNKNKNDEYLHTMILGPPGHGKCLAKDTPVIMYDGTIKSVQNVKEGEKLMGDDSKPRNVISTCSGRETMYLVKQNYGDDYVVNESHILSLRLCKDPIIIDKNLKNYFKLSWFSKEKINTKIFMYNSNDKEKIYQNVQNFIKTLPKKGSIIDINIVEYIKRNKYWKLAYKGYKVSVEFEECETEINPYFYGLWLGSKKVEDTLEIVKYLNCNISQNEINVINKNDSNVTVKNIPREYKINTKNNRLLLLAGIIDSCGYLYENSYEITLNNKILAEDIVFLTRSLGFKSNVKKCLKNSVKNQKKHNEVYYRVVFSGNIEDIPVEIENNKKSNNFYSYDNLSYDIRVKKLEENEYYGFQIDGNHRFLLGDFTVTHNTEVARIIGKIYQAMGILSDTGPFKIAYRDDFVAEYLGQTAIKTRKLLKSCLGGVLFVDEVYSLGPGQKDKDSFAKECMETITAFLSEHKNDFCFIGAGYEEDVYRCFFSGNKGLERRFQWIHKIKEYKIEELVDILLKMISDMKWNINMERKDIIKILEKEKNLFKHAGGDIEIFLSKCKMVHAKRVFSLDKEHMFVFTKEDIVNSLDLIKKNKSQKEDITESIYFGMYT